MTTPLYKTITVTLTVSHQKTKEPATLSLARLSKSLITKMDMCFAYIEKSLQCIINPVDQVPMKL